MDKYLKISYTIFRALFFILFFSLIPSFSVAENQQDLPAWLKRVEFSTKFETEQKPIVYFQTVQPLYQDEEKTNTFYIQPRYNLQAERSAYNLGLGYRRLVSDNLILGLNTFGDYQELHEHGRVGLGGEALGQIFEARINGYFGVTPKRLIDTSGGATTYERVVDGVDYELGASVPYLPWLKIYGSGFWYGFDHASNDVGWKTRLEARVNDNIRLEFFTWDDNKGSQEFGGQVRFTVAFMHWKDIWNAFKPSIELFPHKDLKEELLIPVERNYKIVVERWRQSKGFTVEAGRS